MDEIWGGGEQSASQVVLGPHTSYEFKNSRRQVIFTATRYKFALKMMGNNYQPNTKNILDLGCNDGFGTHFVAEDAYQTVGVDFDEMAIESAQKNISDKNIKFICDDFLGKKYGDFDGICSFDVIEHIYPQNEDLYMQTVLMNLNVDGTFIIGTPSLEHQQYSKECVRNAHVNVYTGEKLYEMLKRYFRNVYLFTQNDEVIHTGHLRMANYLIAVCGGKKEF